MSVGTPLLGGSFSLHHIGWDQLHRRRGWYLLLGILLVISGIIAISFSLLATVISMVFIGVQLVVAGVFLAGFAFTITRWGGFFLDLLMGILYAVTGVLILANPAAGAVALTLMIAMFLLFGGISRIVLALIERFPRWGWTFWLGVVDVLLGLAIWSQWPLSGLWVIGLFVGLEMLFNGWSLVMLSAAARNGVPHEPAPAPSA